MDPDDNSILRDLMERMSRLTAGNPENSAAWERLTEAQIGFEDKKLDQAWKLAQMGESGANARAGMQAGASRYSADAGVKSAKIGADASRYGSDRSLEGTKYSSDRSLEGVKYGADIDRQLGLGKIGVDLVTTAAGLTGPEDVFKYTDLLRGGNMLGGVPYFLGGLLGGTNGVSGFGAPSGTPTPMTMDSILKGLGGGGMGGALSDGTGASELQRNADSFKGVLGSMLSGGMHQFAPGSLEGLNQSELGLLQGASGKLGYNWSDLVQQYQNSRPNQGNPLQA